MNNHNNQLISNLIYLNDFGGDYKSFIDAVYSVFYKDFITDKAKFRNEILKLKWHPIFQERAYTFYHITHKGEDEQNREPDLRRCERITWTKPVIENCDSLQLKIWEQKRGTADRICIWYEVKNDIDYIVIIDVRANYKLLWTTFVLEYPHQKKKKQNEYDEWLKMQKSPGNT